MDTPTRMADANDVLTESTPEAEGWRHDPCGTVLLSASVTHSVYDGPGLSGHGQVQIQQVPYCPTCHEKPSAYGRPITPRDKEWPKVALRPKAGGS